MKEQNTIGYQGHFARTKTIHIKAPIPVSVNYVIGMKHTQPPNLLSRRKTSFNF